MTYTPPRPVDPGRVRRLQRLTRLTVIAWVAAAGLVLVPIAAGGAARGEAPAQAGQDARPEKTPGAPTATPAATRIPPGQAATPRPKPTPRPTPTSDPGPTDEPSPTAEPDPSPTPKPNPGHAGGKARPSASPRPDTGGAVPQANRNNPGTGPVGGQPTAAPAGKGGSGTSTRARPAAAPFSVPGSVAGGHAADNADRAGDQENLFAGDVFLDFDLASSAELLTPAALMALPGLLILGSLAAQVAGGVLWIPITRRLLDHPAGHAGGRGIRRRL